MGTSVYFGVSKQKPKGHGMYHPWMSPDGFFMPRKNATGWLGSRSSEASTVPLLCPQAIAGLLAIP